MPLLTAVTRRVSGRDVVILTTQRACDVPEIAVELRDVDDARAFAGQLTPPRRDDASARVALTDPRRQLVDDVFEFALESCARANEVELVWRYDAAAFEATFGSGARRGDGDESDGDGEYARRRIGVVTLRTMTHCIDRTVELARVVEERTLGRMAAEATSAALERTSAARRALSEEATRAVEETKEDMARRFLALMNAKKMEIMRFREELASAETELEDLRARCERARGASVAGDDEGTSTGGANGRESDDDDDAEYYTTDEDLDPTQRGGRVSARKRFGKSQTQPTQSERGGAKRPSEIPRASIDEREGRAKRKVPSKDKSFLANTLALLDAD